MSTVSAASWPRRHPTAVWLAAVVAGPLVAGVLTPLRGRLDDSHVTLLLVLVVAIVSAAALRPAGVVAAVTAGLAYDFFWTRPYNSFAIFHPADVATVLLLVLVGVAVEQLSWWAQRQHADSDRRSGYLETLRQASGEGAVGDRDVDAVCVVLTGLLLADRCVFALGEGDPTTVLHPDGTVSRRGALLPVDTAGLPTDDTLTLPVKTGSGRAARFEISAATHVARPSLEQRHVAALIAQVTAVHLDPQPAS